MSSLMYGTNKCQNESISVARALRYYSPSNREKNSKLSHEIKNIALPSLPFLSLRILFRLRTLKSLKNILDNCSYKVL